MPVLGFAKGRWYVLIDGEPYITTEDVEVVKKLEIGIKILRTKREVEASSWIH